MYKAKLTCGMFAYQKSKTLTDDHMNLLILHLQYKSIVPDRTHSYIVIQLALSKISNRIVGKKLLHTI